MPLPSPDSGIKWSDYRNSTPTFRLTPVEKPDTSPFLMHMTGRNSLLGILAGENVPGEMQLPANHGFLKATIPTFDFSKSYYNSPVVCFTESPLFALDFFRYRSFRRWEANQVFGLGFSKEYLVLKKNVRPVIYLDDKTNKEILSICNRVDQIIFSPDQALDAELRQTLQRIKPLLFPLLETSYYQGFIWEREWRCPDPVGMSFPHVALKVICCPENERQAIMNLLGENAANIQIVQSWQEYDEVTNFLSERKKILGHEYVDQIEQVHDLSLLHDLKQKNEQTLNALKGYYETFKSTVESLDNKEISKTINHLEATLKSIDGQIKNIVEKEEQKKKPLNDQMQ